MNKLFAIFILGPCLALIWVIALVSYLYFKSYSGPDVNFKISKGEAFSRINYRLKNQDLISSSRVFHKLAQYNNITEKFKPGSYTITSGMTMSDLQNLFLQGSRNYIKVTIPEGKNIFEIAEILEANNLATKKNFVQLAKNSDFVQSLGIKAKRIEGYLYPDTYNFEEHMEVRDLIILMVKNFRQKTENLNWENSGFSLHQLVTLASIVEKETGAAFERPIIAAVFLNRLKKRMRLQSDPTTIYGIYENFNGNLRKRHLLEKTPYNTYKIPALPIGPIANPGIEALNAVLNPSDDKYLYFVSKNDGTHIFTRTYKDHLKAVEKWQINRKNRKGKSWRQLDKGLRANQ